MFGHNFQFKQAHPNLVNNSDPNMRSVSLQRPFYSPQSFVPTELGARAFEIPSDKPTKPFRKKIGKI